MVFVTRLNDKISQGDIVAARAFIIDQLDKDRHLPSMLVFGAKNQVKKEIFSPDNQLFDFIQEKEHWNFDLWITARMELRDNFSEEKLDYCIKIMKHLRKQGNTRFSPSKRHQKPKYEQEEMHHPGFFDRFISKISHKNE